MGLYSIPQIAQIPGLQAALDGKLPVASPAFTGTLTGPAATLTGVCSLGNGCAITGTLGGGQIYTLALVNAWSDAGTTFEALRQNITDAGSASASLLCNLLVNSVSKFSVRKDGHTLAQSLEAVSWAGGSYLWAKNDTEGVYFGAAQNTYLKRTGTGLLSLNAGTGGLQLGSLLSSPAWNAAGTTFDILDFNITDTASASGSRALRVRVGGVDKFAVRKDGTVSGVVFDGASWVGGDFVWAKGNTSGVYFGAGQDTYLKRTGTGALAINDGSGSFKAAAFLDANGVQVVGPQQPAIADATDLASAITSLNELLAANRAHGSIAT